MHLLISLLAMLLCLNSLLIAFKATMVIEQGSTTQFPNQLILGSVLAMGFHPHAFLCTFLWIKQILFNYEIIISKTAFHFKSAVY